MSDSITSLQKGIVGYNPKDVYNYVLKDLLTDEFTPNTPTKIAECVLEGLYGLDANDSLQLSLRRGCIEPLLKDRPHLIERKIFTFTKYYCKHYEGLTEEELVDLEVVAKEKQLNLPLVKLYIGSHGVTVTNIKACEPTIEKQVKQLSKYFEEKYKSPLYVVNSYRRAPGWEEYLAKLE